MADKQGEKTLKQIQSLYRRLAVALVCAGLAGIGEAAELAIQSFDGTGQLTFNTLNNATNYRVEWASSPGGPWTNFTGAATRLDAIPQPPLSGIVTCSVPMCYRVVATVTNAAPTAPEGMVLIPAGSFVMGATTNMGHESYSGETPQHTVYVSAFCMDRYEVTKAKWDEVRTWAATNGYSGLSTGDGKAVDHPVQAVSWYDAVKWCNARSQKEGRTPCYTNATGTVHTNGDFAGGCNWTATGYRLPTEAEWEKAARGGVPNHRFPWNDSDEIQHARANYASTNSYAYDTSPTPIYHPTYTNAPMPYTSPTGSFAPNNYGLYDMAGNVWEWCWDRYSSSYYNSSPGTDPRGPVSTSCVSRGGGWSGHPVYCRSAHRRDFSPVSKIDSIGFRVVLLPPDQ